MFYSCRSEDSAIQQKQLEDNRFAVFVAKTPSEKINYANGFGYLMKRYDSLYETNYSRIKNKPAMNALADSGNNISAVQSIMPYVAFNIYSQTITEKNGDKWVVFPQVQGTQVIGLIAGILTQKETHVSFRRLNEESDFYKENIRLFQEVLDKHQQRKKLQGIAGINPMASIGGSSGCSQISLQDGKEICIDEVFLRGRPSDLPFGGNSGITNGPGGTWWPTVIKIPGVNINGKGGSSSSSTPQADPKVSPISDPKTCKSYGICIAGGNQFGNKDPKDLCIQASTVGKTNDTKLLMTILQKRTSNTTTEYGYLLTDAGGGKTNNIPVQGAPGAASIQVNVSSPIDGYIHSHYSGLLSIFSVADIFGIAELYKNNLIKDLNTFTIGVVTDSGTQYLMVIENINKFTNFANNLFTGKSIDPTALKGYEFVYDKVYGINPSNNGEKNEKAFVNYLESTQSGLKIIKGTPNMGNWSTLNKDPNDGVIRATPCP